MEELHPPGTRVKQLEPSTNMLLAGTVMDIPLHSNPNGSAMYQVLFDNGTSASISLGDGFFDSKSSSFGRRSFHFIV
jgi:hypothetical protein